MKRHFFLATLALSLITAGALADTASKWKLKTGTPALQSAGSLAFGPDGVLFVADPKSATVFAIDTGDASGKAAEASWSVAGLDTKIATAAGVNAKDVAIEDLAVNPYSGHVYFAATCGGKPTLLRLDAKGVSVVKLDGIAHSSLTLADAPEDKDVQVGNRKKNLRPESITDLAFENGSLLIAGASTGQSTASIREFGFPFQKAGTGTNLEIYHAAHGRTEDSAVPRVFIPFNVGGEPSVLAGFTCTPLVQFPLASLEPGAKAKGKTVAELGNRNQPIDMFVYEKDGQDYLLIANTARGVMKVNAKNIEKQAALTEKVAGGGSAGLSYETIADLKGVVQLDRLNTGHAVILVKTDAGFDLQTVPLP